jgi:molecular chaperone GrpE (heat shock protein)
MTSDQIKAARCEECGNTGIVGDMPCECSHGDAYRDLTSLEMALRRQNEELRAELEAAKEIAGKYEDKYFSANADLEAANRHFQMEREQWKKQYRGLFQQLEAARKAIEAKDELLRAVMWWHQDPESAEYNECEKDPCYWCMMAQATFDAATKGEQP